MNSYISSGIVALTVTIASIAIYGNVDYWILIPVGGIFSAMTLEIISRSKDSDYNIKNDSSYWVKLSLGVLSTYVTAFIVIRLMIGI